MKLFDAGRFTNRKSFFEPTEDGSPIGRCELFSDYRTAFDNALMTGGNPFVGMKKEKLEELINIRIKVGELYNEKGWGDNILDIKRRNILGYLEGHRYFVRINEGSEESEDQKLHRAYLNLRMALVRDRTGEYDIAAKNIRSNLVEIGRILGLTCVTYDSRIDTSTPPDYQDLQIQVASGQT